MHLADFMAAYNFARRRKTLVASRLTNTSPKSGCQSRAGSSSVRSARCQDYSPSFASRAQHLHYHATTRQTNQLLRIMLRSQPAEIIHRNRNDHARGDGKRQERRGADFLSYFQLSQQTAAPPKLPSQAAMAVRRTLRSRAAHAAVKHANEHECNDGHTWTIRPDVIGSASKLGIVAFEPDNTVLKTPAARAVR